MTHNRCGSCPLLALTDLHSAKIRRIRRNPRVLIASCRANGKLRCEAVPARVEVLTATSERERVQKLLIERYKISYRLVMLIYRLGRRLRGRRRRRRRAGDHGRIAGGRHLPDRRRRASVWRDRAARR